MYGQVSVTVHCKKFLPCYSNGEEGCSTINTNMCNYMYQCFPKIENLNIVDYV